MRRALPPKVLFPLAQAAIAAVVAVFGQWRAALVLGGFAVLLLISARLEGADKTSATYLTRVIWGFRAIGVGFAVWATLQLLGVVERHIVAAALAYLAAPLSFLAARQADAARTSAYLSEAFREKRAQARTSGR